MGKTWPEGQGVESGLEPSPAAVATIPVASTAAAAAATTAAAEGPELELPVPSRRLDELSRFAELRRDLSLFTQPDDLHQDIYLLGCGGQVFHFRHCLFVHAFTSADTSRRVAKGREKPTTRRIQTMWANCPDEPLL